MRLSSRRSRAAEVSYWPGFVDAMTTLLLVILFILSVFILAQHYLSRELSGRDTALDSLRHQISELSRMLALERDSKQELALNLSSFKESLTLIESDNARLSDREQQQSLSGEQDRIVLDSLRSNLSDEQRLSEIALSKVDILNLQISALRRQIAALEVALDTSEQRDRESNIQITNLGQRLNVALARKVSQLALYRSDFLGRLRSLIGNRPGITIDRDRFVFQSEVLFASGSSTITPAGKNDINTLVGLIKELENLIPNDIDWVLRVDGHTDVNPISTPQFPSNWELSQARALAVVRTMIDDGIPPNRLIPAGLGEFHPVDPQENDQAYQLNRRIEIKLTQR